MDLLLSHIRIVLGREYHCIQSGRLAVVVLYGHLGFPIRTQIFQRSVFSHFRQLQTQFMSQRDRIRHIVLGLVGGETEHHTLIPGTDGLDLGITHLVFFGFQRFINAHGDIGGLLIDSSDHTAGFCIKTIFSSGVTDFLNRIAHDLLNIYIRICGDLTHYQHQSCGSGRFTCHTAHGVLCQKRVQNSIGNLVAHFIGMAFCY